MPRSKSAKKPTRHEALDDFLGAIRGKGDQPIAILVRDVLNLEEPIETKRVLAAVDLFKTDDRFVVTGDGIDAQVRMAGEEPTSGEPEEITVEGQKVESATMPVLPDREGQAVPPPTGEAAPVPTIGEQLEQQQAQTSAKDEAPDIETTHAVAGSSTIEQDILARLKEVLAAIEAQENTIHHLGEDLKAHKDRVKVLEAERDALIKGEIPPTKMGEKDPMQTPVGKAASGEAPMLSKLVEPTPVEGLGMIRQMGAESARLGKLETDCPYSKDHAKERSMWLDGFREQKREDHSEREAQALALFRDDLLKASIPGGEGLLPPGEECPKVLAVKWNDQPHLVVGMLSAEENPASVERWHLVPLFKRDEWSSGEVCLAQTYGEPVAGVSENPEREEQRKKGGVDCARWVKVGRSKLIVGPLQLLMVATVNPAEQPSH